MYAMSSGANSPVCETIAAIKVGSVARLPVLNCLLAMSSSGPYLSCLIVHALRTLGDGSHSMELSLAIPPAASVASSSLVVHFVTAVVVEVDVGCIVPPSSQNVWSLNSIVASTRSACVPPGVHD